MKKYQKTGNEMAKKGGKTGKKSRRNGKKQFRDSSPPSAPQFRDSLPKKGRFAPRGGSNPPSHLDFRTENQRASDPDYGDP